MPLFYFWKAIFLFIILMKIIFSIHYEVKHIKNMSETQRETNNGTTARGFWIDDVPAGNQVKERLMMSAERKITCFQLRVTNGQCSL